MSEAWRELLAVDRFVARSEGPFHQLDREYVTTLYLPIIGPIAYSFFLSLVDELSPVTFTTDPQSHHFFLNRLQTNIQAVLQARRKLEGIGLLETDVSEVGDVRLFRYTLKAPLEPRVFLNDPLLFSLLSNTLGERQMHSLSERYRKKTAEDEGQPFLRITSSFQEQFTRSGEREPLLRDHLVGRVAATPTSVNQIQYDWQMFLDSLSPTLLDRSLFTPPVKEKLVKMAFLYGIDAMMLAKFVLASLNRSGEIDFERLQTQMSNWAEQSGEQPKLKATTETQPDALRTTANNPLHAAQSSEEQLIHYFEATSPRQFLIDMSNGTNPTPLEMSIVNDLLMKQNMLPGVVNVLLHFVMLRTNMRLNRAYVEQVASQWARHQVATVRDAMQLAREEHKKGEQAKAERSGNGTQRTRGKNPRQETVPSWVAEYQGANRDQKQQAEAPQPQKSAAEIEAMRRKLEEELKR
ncbi:MAG: replication initiation and membrane attachment family protein [Bacilli bacterium]